MRVNKEYYHMTYIRTTKAQVAQARNMSIGEHRHCCVTFEISGFVWEKNLSFL